MDAIGGQMSSSVTWESLDNPIIKKTWLNGVFVGFVMLFIYNDVIIVKLCEIAATGLLIAYLFQYCDRQKQRIYLFYVIAVGFVLIALPFNPLYPGIDKYLILVWYSPRMLSTDFLLALFWGYGAMTLIGVITSLIVSYYNKRKMMWKLRRFLPIQSTDKDIVVSIFYYFLKDPTAGKSITLFLFLTLASLVEEILYRFILVDVLSFAGINIIVVVIISMAVFGWGHIENGNWAYIVNSAGCAAIFAIVGLQFGLLAGWTLHGFWNAFVVLEHKIELWSQGY